jgi:uncharacterized protein YdaU (DUF1376 family)
MHYYQFSIGDYSSHTQHLDPIEDIAYRRMLDWYYTHEKPLPNDVQEIARQIRMREHLAAIRDVLNEFFELTDAGWFSARADKEIKHYQSKKEQASRAGKASAERRFNGRSTDVQPTNNHKPITINQEPIGKTPPRKRSAPPKPADVDEQTWADWLSLRKTKRAPVTETVLRGARSEAAKAGMSLEDFLRVWCRRGSQGLEASWLKDNERTPQKSFAQQERERGWARWEEMTGQQHPERLAHEGKAQGQVIDVTPSFLEIEQ